ncbi:hypothetical protein sos41_13120 [Alphaproteobacteria bacterium SO-S41]|nr:hypothetical protein sos41_13120 [Alphaproteobacteria bacterium SO-S41]
MVRRMELDALIRMAAALGAVLGLVLLAAWAMRRFGLGGLAMTTAGPKRLSIVEARRLDARRQLVLLRRDGIEHLVILSATGETVIETGIPAEAAP